MLTQTSKSYFKIKNLQNLKNTVLGVQKLAQKTECKFLLRNSEKKPQKLTKLTRKLQNMEIIAKVSEMYSEAQKF